MYNTATHMLVGPQINCHLFGADLKKKLTNNNQFH